MAKNKIRHDDLAGWWIYWLGSFMTLRFFLGLWELACVVKKITDILRAPLWLGNGVAYLGWGVVYPFIHTLGGLLLTIYQIYIFYGSKMG